MANFDANFGASLTTQALYLSMKNNQVYQKIIAENTANANTPNYKTKLLREPRNFADLVSAQVPSQLRISSQLHMRPQTQENDYTRVVLEEGLEAKPNGNNVSLPLEAEKATKNKLDYEAKLHAYQGLTELFNRALKRD